MTAPVHYAVEVLFDTVFQPACENQRELDCFTEGDPDAEMTDDEGAVTCAECLKALGYDVAPDSGWVRAAA